MRVHFTEPPVLEVHGWTVEFATRHARLATYLLALSGSEGLLVSSLGRWLWPDAPPHRWAPRVRTLLWQVRNALGDQAWRVERRGPIVVMELIGAEVVIESGIQPGAIEPEDLMDQGVLPSVLVNDLARLEKGRSRRRRGTASSFR